MAPTAGTIKSRTEPQRRIRRAHCTAAGRAARAYAASVRVSLAATITISVCRSTNCRISLTQPPYRVNAVAVRSNGLSAENFKYATLVSPCTLARRSLINNYAGNVPPRRGLVTTAAGSVSLTAGGCVTVGFTRVS